MSADRTIQTIPLSPDDATADSPSTAPPGDPTRTLPHTLPSAPPAAAERYRFGEEIARGGMGAVYRATDTALNREVAVKVVQTGSEYLARRFADEAHITGQLQHPNIPPVYDLGRLPDGRPFLAMKLIKGETLDALLKADGPGSGRWLAVFERVCEAVGYAHAHGVIHRDLKPQNVMVGAFGEVQVMDWGLAKVLSVSREAESSEPSADPEAITAPTAIVPTRDADEATRAGSILGTPAYMPPEQAIGAVDQIDARSDVFGLGAILCALLTGKPPYLGADAESTRQLAARGKLDDAFARLATCGAEPELVALCKRCLSAEKADRPADAGLVAAEVAALRAAAEDRAKRAELDAARLEVRAAEETKRRRVQLVFGLTMALVVMVSVGAALWWEADRRRKAVEAEVEQVRMIASIAERVRRDLATAEPLLAQARVAPDTFAAVADADAQIDLWARCSQLADRAEERLANGPGDQTTQAAVTGFRREVDQGMALAQERAARARHRVELEVVVQRIHFSSEEHLAGLYRLVELDPRYGPSHFALAEGLAVHRRYREALAAMEQAVQLGLDGRSAQSPQRALTQCGDFLLAIADMAGAMKRYQDALRFGEDRRVRLKLVAVAGLTKQWSQVESDYQTAARTGPAGDLFDEACRVSDDLVRLGHARAGLGLLQHVLDRHPGEAIGPAYTLRLQAADLAVRCAMDERIDLATRRSLLAQAYHWLQEDIKRCRVKLTGDFPYEKNKVASYLQQLSFRRNLMVVSKQIVPGLLALGLLSPAERKSWREISGTVDLLQAYLATDGRTLAQDTFRQAPMAGAGGGRSIVPTLMGD